MTTQNLKRKKRNNHSSDRKRLRLLKDSNLIKTLSFKHVSEHAEEEIETIKQQLEFILGVTKTGLDIIDSDFNIRYIDPEWAKIYGDPSGKKCYQYFMGRSEICPRCGIPIALETKTITVTEEILVKEGNRPIQVTTIPFQNAKGEWLVAEVNVDISERKRSEETLLKAHEELEIRVQERTAELSRANEAMQIEITERKRAEERLRESEEKHRTIIGSIEDAYYEVDLAGNFTFFNDSLCRMLGYSRDELMGMNNRQYTDQENSKILYLAFNKVYKTGNPTEAFDWEVIRKTGEKRFGEVSISLMKDSEGRPCGFRGIARDITDRKRAEEALRESEEKYRSILEGIEDSYYEVDLAGNLTFFNDSLCRLVGYSKEELMGLNNRQLTNPVNAQKLYREFNKVYRTGESRKVFDWEIIKKDGLERNVEASVSLVQDSRGHPIGFRGIVRDITERKRAVEALQESESKYRQLVEYAPIGIYELDLNELKFLSVNDVMCDIMGYSKEEFLCMSPYTLLTEESKIALAERMKKLLAGEKVQESVELKLRTKNGKEFWALINSKLFYQDGKPYKAQVVAQDISERKRLEEQLIQSQKMEAIGQLAGGIAHDFNNLLTVIQGYSQLSLLDLKESDPLWGNIQEIQKATQKATNLTRHLLAFSRRQILDPKVLDLNVLLKDLDKMLRRIIGEDMELVPLLAHDLGKVKIDPGQIEQVVLNLAVNARDAMPSGGKLTIETANIILDESYAHTHVGVIPGHYVRLSVSDNGVGMSKDVMEKIFEPFFTTKEKSKGTGLGLSTVYGIVKQSGGNIWVYSEPSHGTTFKIYLPRVEEDLEPLPERDETDFLRGGSETVLLVEDEQEVRLLAKRLLSQQGYKVLEASDGEEALHVAQKHAEKKIHLLLTDVVMPQMGGKELADQLKILKPDVKVLYISGYTDDAIIQHGVLAPGTHFLQKPFSLKTLSHKVREVLDG